MGSRATSQKKVVKRLCVAIACLMSLSAGVPTLADTPFDTGVKLFGQGNYQQALSSFSAAESGGKKDANTYYYLALCCQQLKQYAKARDLFTYTRTRFPDSDAAVLCEQALVRFNQTYKASAPPAAAAAGTSTDPNASPETTTVPFSRADGSHISVRVLVNGQPVTMWLDTGASITTIPQSVLNQNNIKIPTVKNAMRVMGVGGEASASVGRVILQFGEISQLVPVCIQDDTIPGAAIDIPLLGQSFLAAFNYEINYRNNTIKLTRIRPGAVQNRTKRGVASYSREQNVVPFTFGGNTMYVTVKVNGRECEMIFDTGAANVVFSDKSMGALGLNVPIHSSRQTSAGVGGKREGYGFSLDEVQLGSVVKNRVRASMAGYSAIPKPLLGYSFLEGTDFVVDNEAKVIRFAP